MTTPRSITPLDSEARQGPPATRVDPEAVAAAAIGNLSVLRLFSGDALEIATYLPGKRVRGVRVRESEVEVHVVARWGTSLPRVAEEVRRSVDAVVGGLPVSVYIDDVETPNRLDGRPRGGSTKSA